MRGPANLWATTQEAHPAPARNEVSTVVLVGGLAAAPAAWIVQLIVNYGLASHACYPSTAPWLVRPPPGWSSETLWLAALNLTCLIIAVGAGAVSWRNWRRTRDEKGGDAESALSIGEGRTRFMAGCGILTGLGFALAILFQTLQPFVLPSCWRMVS